MDSEELYPCVGICTPDPDSGYCLGCGRPPLESPGIVHEPAGIHGGAENEEAGTRAPAS
ncbi:DUF1289 domain-containing protein [Azovibrio restrictus]|uniref:DUF1289 domain-containing protein n=1 Tax=Azovibrio restrictus TaxID=146938 RepID=UPI0026F1D98F|nr:DUF1289 domain-containing protein [Azovibrio restrictus]MDD3482809.1 DUF1289 domain-containing protein [Azovibrio restrictus]